MQIAPRAKLYITPLKYWMALYGKWQCKTPDKHNDDDDDDKEQQIRHTANAKSTFAVLIQFNY